MSEPTNTEIMDTLRQVLDITRTIQAIQASQGEKLDSHDQRLTELTDLSLTLHNKVDALRYNVDSMAGVLGVMHVSQNALMGAILDIRKDLREHTHD